MTRIAPEIAALVLFLSRERIAPDEFDTVRSMAACVTDWDVLTSLSARKFVAPMVYAHLAAVRPHSLPEPALERMKEQAMLATMGSLRAASAQQNFFQTCIAPVGYDHAFVKGVALAQRFYDNPGMRFCRDVDVLVPDVAIKDVIQTALSNGFKVKIKDNELTSHPSPEAINTLLKYDQIVVLSSPEGVWMEVHTKIDYGLELFDTTDLLLKAVPLDAPTGPRGLATAEQFCFACYHSARHTWSRLHWLADVDAMLRHRSFDHEEVMALARRVGLEPTVNATIDFINATRSADWMDNSGKINPNARQMLRHCLANLEDDFQTELRLRARFGYLGLPYGWMLSEDHKLRAYINRSLMGLSPSYYLYEKFPLPSFLHWVYYPMKPFVALWRRFAATKY